MKGKKHPKKYPTYTLKSERIDDHLEITIPEISAAVCTLRGKTSRDDVCDAGHLAIIAHLLRHRPRRRLIMRSE